jgi:hypothetical protein
VFLIGIDGSRKGEKECKMTQEVGSQKRKGEMPMWTDYEQTVNQQCYLEVMTRLREFVRRKDPNSGLTSGFSTMTMPLRMMRLKSSQVPG